jgi:hypothetical protein
VFELVSDYAPAGDQPQAIGKLTEALLAGAKHQVLQGVTGSGKTFSVANVIKNVDRPTLVISHNKTLAAHRELLAPPGGAGGSNAGGGGGGRITIQYGTNLFTGIVTAHGGPGLLMVRRLDRKSW